MVRYGSLMRMPERRLIRPAMRKTTVRGLRRVKQSRALLGPESLRFVTSQTSPPRPPREAAPPPCAPVKAEVELDLGVPNETERQRALPSTAAGMSAREATRILAALG